MRITNKEKLKMCKEHLEENKSLSHISERYNNYDISRIKYFVNLYKRYGEDPVIVLLLRSFPFIYPSNFMRHKYRPYVPILQK